MPLITDPDSLSQGTLNVVADLAFTASAGIATTLTGTASLPALADNEFFEIRNSSVPGNNGLYQVNDASPTTSSITVDKVTGINPVNLAAESTDVLGTTGASTEKSIHFDTGAEGIYILEQGNVDTAGVIMLALHSFTKEEWKADQSLIDSGAFPMVGISFAAGQWEFGEDPSGNNSDWRPIVNATFLIDTVRLIRNAGWEEKNNAGVVQKKFFNVSTLGTFEDALDQAEYYFGDSTDTDNTRNYAFTGVVNEAVQYFDNITPADGGTGFAFATTTTLTRNDGGDWIAEGYVEGGQITIANAEDAGNNGTFLISAVTATVITSTGFTNNLADTTMTAAYNNSNLFTTILRIRDGDPNGKSFGLADLAAAGETAISSKIIKFPLANATDLDISETDANIDANTPYTEVRPRYLAAPYNREVDSAAKRAFGIIIDVGTYSESNGASATTTLFTSAAFALGAGEALADYTGGSLIIHEGTDQGTHTIVGTPVDNAGTLEITLSVALTATESSLSFTVERATPLTALKGEIYEKLQRQLRQATDIDEGTGTVIGKMVGGLAKFVGPDITFGIGSLNPAGGGTGVIVEGFDANDTNSMFFVDNTAVTRNFPFVAAGNLNFNTNLTSDSAPEFFLYFQYTSRTTNSDIDVVAPAGDSYDLEGTLPNMAVNDHIRISGFAQAANNGLFIVVAENVASSDYTIRRKDGENVGTLETNQTVNVDENPYNSPDAILVDNNAGADIVGAASVASVAFDFDYDGNVQGGRTAATDAVCVLKAVGLEVGQYVEIPGLLITRTTGLSFTATSPLERNYSNPV